MKQFTESFHLWRCSYGTAKRILSSIGIDGVVFNETNHWTTVVPLDGNSQLTNFSKRFDGVLLHYLYDEHYAWMTNLVSHRQLISSYINMWVPEYYVKDDLLNIEAFFPYLLSPDYQSEFKMIFLLDDFEDIFEVNPAYRFAHLIGIKNYRYFNTPGTAAIQPTKPGRAPVAARLRQAY